MKHTLLPALALLLLTQCHKADPAPAQPEDQLPPATQTGAHTFGCLLNGQPWMPNNSILNNNYKITYDPTYLGGALQIKVNRYAGANNSVLQSLTFGAAYVNKTGVYSFPLNGLNSIFYTDTGASATCRDYGNLPKSTYQTGTLTITRFDQSVVSGTFAFKLAQPGCDTLRITKGRFDYTL